MKTYIAILTVDGTVRVLDSRPGESFVVDSFIAQYGTGKPIALVRDYRFGSPGKPCCFWTLGVGHFQLLDETGEPYEPGADFFAKNPEAPIMKPKAR
jgi:hypothetical protein